MRFPILIALTALAMQAVMCAELSKNTPLEPGSQPPEWTLTEWLNSDPLTLKSLHGKAVLVRWWTAPQCPYCRITAPALNDFHARYRDSGLQVIGIYHHKVPQPLTTEHVKKYISEYGFKFPIAIDTGWTTLRRWWLTGGDTDKDKWTSVTFLLDRKGIVRHIHPGGQYVKGDAAYEELEKKIIELLAQKE